MAVEAAERMGRTLYRLDVCRLTSDAHTVHAKCFRLQLNFISVTALVREI
jgi:hypothetical protein